MQTTSETSDFVHPSQEDHRIGRCVLYAWTFVIAVVACASVSVCKYKMPISSGAAEISTGADEKTMAHFLYAMPKRVPHEGHRSGTHPASSLGTPMPAASLLEKHLAHVHFREQEQWSPITTSLPLAAQTLPMSASSARSSNTMGAAAVRAWDVSGKHVLMSCISLAAFGALSLGAWVQLSRSKFLAEVASQNVMAPLDHGGVSLTTLSVSTLDMSTVRAAMALTPTLAEESGHGDVALGKQVTQVGWRAGATSGRTRSLGVSSGAVSSCINGTATKGRRSTARMHSGDDTLGMGSHVLDYTKAYCLCIPPRRGYMEGLLTSWGFKDVCYMTGLDQARLDLETCVELDVITPEYSSFLKQNRDFIPEAKVACHLGHLRILADFYQNQRDKDYALIFEDDLQEDASPSDVQMIVEQFLDALPFDGFDFVHFGFLLERQDETNGQNDSSLVCRSVDCLGRHAYLVTKPTAECLLGNTLPMWNHGDKMYNDIIKQFKLRAFRPKDPLFFQDRQRFKSTLRRSAQPARSFRRRRQAVHDPGLTQPAKSLRQRIQTIYDRYRWLFRDDLEFFGDRSDLLADRPGIVQSVRNLWEQWTFRSEPNENNPENEENIESSDVLESSVQDDSLRGSGHAAKNVATTDAPDENTEDSDDGPNRSDALEKITDDPSETPAAVAAATIIEADSAAGSQDYSS